MGRAMLIICAGMLVALGIVSIGTSGQGKLLTEKTVEYAQKTEALNAAHTAIQISMQKINKDNNWAKDHDSLNPWVTTIDGVQTTLYKVATDKDLSYEPTDELIARLANTTSVQYLTGTTDQTLGTSSDPGVFFVEDNLKLTGKQDEGYGILVIRSDGEMSYEGDDGSTLDIAGNFEWNGLVIFENAYNFKGRGTPTINGSVLVGNTSDYDGSIGIDLNGNIHLQYDCAAEEYAKMAAANAVDQNKYTRVVTLEETAIE